MSTNQQRGGWEDKFEERFTDDKWCSCGGEYDSERQRKNLKSFIKETLATERERVLGEIKTVIKNSRTTEEHLGVGIREVTARTQVLVDIITSLKEQL